jgi:hypothetical protein
MDAEPDVTTDLDAHVAATTAALERDIDYLEHEAAKAGKAVAQRIIPPLAVFLGLCLLAWISGRRLRKRSEAKRWASASMPSGSWT